MLGKWYTSCCVRFVNDSIVFQFGLYHINKYIENRGIHAASLCTSLYIYIYLRKSIKRILSISFCHKVWATKFQYNSPSPRPEKIYIYMVGRELYRVCVFIFRIYGIDYDVEINSSSNLPSFNHIHHI